MFLFSFCSTFSCSQTNLGERFHSFACRVWHDDSTGVQQMGPNARHRDTVGGAHAGVGYGLPCDYDLPGDKGAKYKVQLYARI